MAWDSRKSRAAVFPAKLKTFVKDVTGHRRRHSGQDERKAEQLNTAKAEMPAEMTSEQPQQPPWTITPRPTTKHAGREYGLSVQVSLQFEDPLDFSYNRTYHSSPNFKATERICRGLLRRIDHSLFELITRKDLTASAATEGDGNLKPKRFEMTIDISQGGSKWASRTYKSYQKEPLTADGAQEVILSTHRMVGLFLRRHDPDFKLKDGAVRDEIANEPETSPYRIGKIQPMNCIPRSRFLEKSQAFEIAPGFTIELSVTSNSSRRKPPEWRQTIEVNSSQSAPLNLETAEGLLADASCAVDGAVRSRIRIIQTQHNECPHAGGSCQHYQDKGTKVHLRVRNNLGPEFDHMERTTDTKAVLLGDAQDQDSLDFMDTLERALQGAKDMADDTISKMKDLDFRVVELHGRGWTLEEPLIFTLAATSSFSRRSIEAILDRVQTGVAEILRGNAVSVRMTATKRGHFILDKTLVAREPLSKAEARRWSSPTKNKASIVSRLQRRIEEDIRMICKDTLSLDDLGDDELPAVEVKVENPPKEPAVPQHGEEAAEEAPVDEDDSSSSSVTSDETDEDASSVRAEVDYLEDSETAPSVMEIGNTGSVSETPVDVTLMQSASNEEDKEASELPQPIKVVRDPKTGTRVFPLIPSPVSEHSFDEFFTPGLPKPDDEQKPTTQETTNGTVTSDDIQQTAIPSKETGSTISEFNDSQAVAQQTPEKSVDIEHAPQDELGAGPETAETIPETPKKSRGAINHDNKITTRARNISGASSDLSKRGISADDLSSLAPTTPSLVAGENSPRNSLMLLTPKNPGSDEVKLVMRRDSEDDTDYITSNGAVLVEDQQRFLKLVPSFSKHRPDPSPLQVVTNDKDGGLDSVSHVEEVPVNQDQQQQRTVLEHILKPKVEETETASAPVAVDQKDAEMTGRTSEAGNTGKGTDNQSPLSEFAQTRQDFDFSSPFPESPALLSEQAIDDSVDDPIDSIEGLVEHAIEEETPRSRALSLSLALPPSRGRPSPITTRTRQKSFGSAGLLGFHGEQLFEIGLRQALMGSSHPQSVSSTPRSPRSPFFRPITPPSLRQRSVSPAFLSRRPASSGRELQLATTAGNSLAVKRSVSSDTLRELRRQQKEDEGGRRPSLLFLVAGVTLASQIVRSTPG